MVKKGMREWRGGRSAPTEYPMSETTRAAFQRALRAMNKARVPYSIGGALALHWYSGFWRVAKDLDLFVLPEHLDWAMGVLASSGFSTRIRHPQWLAEAILEPNKVDLVFGMGNWLQYVDRAFIEEARPGIVLGEKSWIAPPEEMIYSKAFVASRERYDAADIYHLLVAVKGQLDWSRLLMRFEEHWEVLLSHLVLFRYVYPPIETSSPDGCWINCCPAFKRRGENRGRAGSCVEASSWTDRHLFIRYQGVGYRDAREEAWEELQLRSAKAA